MSATPATHDRHRAGAARRRARCALIVGLLTLAATLPAAACGGGGGGSSDTSSTTMATSPVPVVLATDPAVPVAVEVGHRFSIVLPADPGEGWRWVVQPFDTAVLVALGSEFSDDPGQRSAATAVTSTTLPATRGAGAASTTTTAAAVAAAPGDAPSPTTSTTSVPPLVQIVSFAGRAPGTVALSLRATQIVPTPDARPVVVTWTVQVTASPPPTR